MADRGLFTSHASFDSILQVSEPTTKPALTKVACTLGPCSREVDILEKMLEAGMACARFDFSWGTKDYHNETVENLTRAIRHTKMPCAFMLDTEGTEIHVHNKSREPLIIQKGASVVLTCNPSVVATAERLPVSISSFADMPLEQGTSVFIGQYLFTGSETTSVYLTVVEVMDDQHILCVANENATLAGLDFVVNFSAVCSPLPILSEKDTDAIRTFGKMNKIHFLNLSLCRTAEDVLTCRAFLDKVGLKSTKILAKIESLTALRNFTEILSVADGIIFSRGLIGLDIALEKVVRVQKYVIDECIRVFKPVVVTRVMDTMTETPRPTRAEATDIANLVLEGVDCLLLGAETFRGKHPTTTIRMVQDISKQAEATFDSELFHKKRGEEAHTAFAEQGPNKLESLAYSAVRAAALIAADLVIVFTVSGRAARVLSKFRPPVPILAVVFPKLVSTGLKWTFTGEYEARHLLVSRNCVPILADPNLGGTAESEAAEMEGSMLNRAIAYAYNKKWIKLGSRIVLSQHAKKNMDWTFEEAAVVKIIVVGEEVLDAAIDTYNVHSKSVQNLKVRMFAHMSKTSTFKGIPINEMPTSIPTRSQETFTSIHEDRLTENDEEEDEEEDENDAIYEISDVPRTPEESFLNQ